MRNELKAARKAAKERARINAGHMRRGVTLIDPARVYIDGGVTIGEGTVIHPNCTLEKGTHIGRRCLLYPNSRLCGAVIADEVTVESSILLECEVGSHTQIGPFAYIRPHTVIGAHCRIGDFVEIKNSTIGDETKISHLTYVGDGDLGKEVNLGCGVVFVNYDGQVKRRSVVEDKAFIGCNSNLVAPVCIGEEAYIAAGSTVTEDVPQGALYIARARGTVKEAWAIKRKANGKR
jgi:bifunctional UDP-N-acetylglucosamine pyrophosphorylase/glucosamine-1-phosphate N-acetyltransferase